MKKLIIVAFALAILGAPTTQVRLEILAIGLGIYAVGFFGRAAIDTLLNKLPGGRRH